MVLHSEAFLKRCEELARHDVPLSIAVGSTVARGFADLGYEEFLVMPNGALLSLYSGELSRNFNLDDPELFLVPELAQMQDAVIELGYDIVSLELRDRRDWMLKICCAGSKNEVSIKDSKLEEVFLAALLQISVR